ncbi:39S ribosomal protein L38, mitochondrial [Clupea harengus]|uniref:Large ribosomal subunit protein mL38 n=1 Tax=Clupea harengus TaxID=7950 RepID=A0A6P3VQL2_CLUHA|nr:39S ribosomal protein L38, mitochondrial [Clupea harengus]
MATPWCTAMRRAILITADVGVNINARGLGTTASLHRRVAPLGPMPNEDIDVNNLESLEKYRSYARYVRAAQEASKKPVWWKTYRQYLDAENPDKDGERVDIGLPFRQGSRLQVMRERNKVMKENRRNPELERATRLRTLQIPLDRVKEEWERTNGPYHIQRLAEHYGIYRDLFPMAFFVPRVMMHVHYGDDASTAVYYGNQLPAATAAAPPRVTYEAEEGSLWTILLTCPDEHLQDGEQEYVHWLVGNIPGSAVELGQEVCHYLPPVPAKGTGFHRFILVLFKQDAPVDYTEDCRLSPCYSLTERTFKTVDFYRKHQDVLTPASLAFFQSQWDESVTNTFHTLLNMREPVFEYERPPVYHPPQRKFPHRQPLRYLDRYRDGKEHTYGNRY